MFFTVTSIEPTQNGILVTGMTSIGSLKGIWKSDTVPVVGKSCQIELDFHGLDFGTIARQSITLYKKSVPAKTELLSGGVRFTGLCETIDEIYYIRFAFDGLEMLEIADDDQSIRAGDWIAFTLPFDRIGIYPY